MYRVRKIFRVPIGHRLSCHKGLCKNIHGHNLKIEVQVSSDKLNDNGMVIDFSDLKKSVEDILIHWDHALILNSNSDGSLPILLSEMSKSEKVICFDCEPTAENLSRILFDSIRNVLYRDYGLNSNIRLEYIGIWENDDSFAIYSPEE